MTIIAAEHEYKLAPAFDEIPLVHRPHLLYPAAAQRISPTLLPTKLHRRLEIIAYVNHGRWLADCPDPTCGGAVVASPADPRFYCPYCLNHNADGQLIRVVFPDQDTLAEAEAELLKRPHRSVMNYDPRLGETAATLRAENDEHGIG